MATAHLVCGYLGAGKTTFARPLADRVGAVRISLDEWYLGLFSPGGPTSHLDVEALNRLWRVLDDHWPVLLRRNLDVVLDFGFWTRARRDSARQIAESVGATPAVYWVRCPDEVALARCLARDPESTTSFIIDPEAFLALQSKFEPLAPEEQYQVVETG